MLVGFWKIMALGVEFQGGLGWVSSGVSCKFDRFGILIHFQNAFREMMYRPASYAGCA